MKTDIFDPELFVPAVVILLACMLAAAGFGALQIAAVSLPAEFQYLAQILL